MKIKKSRIYLINQADRRFWRGKIRQVLSAKEELLKGSLRPLVKNFQVRKGRSILKSAVKHSTPFYLFDEAELIKSVTAFKAAFRNNLPNCQIYYAVKVNWHPYILKTAVRQGLGLDVSSGRELKLGLKAGAKKMVFSGPGKTEVDLRLALAHREKVIIHLDSFQELEKLGGLTSQTGQVVKAGVRIFTKTHGPWSKFGIPLSELKQFWLRAKKYPFIRLEGIQSHLSWNKDATPYQKIIKEVGGYLKRNFTQKELTSIKFIDLGGGFLPYRSTAYYPWGTAQGDVIQKAGEYFGLQPKFLHHYYITEAVTLEAYARGMAKAIKQYLKPLVNCAYFTEPGRIICNNAMHLVMKVADVKNKNSVILDGGINLVGWEGLRYDYAPIINLNNFSEKEIDCRIYGCLCMADDIWGYSVYAKKMNVGDIIAIPYQGAYTFSLAQNFIKEIPPVYNLK